MKTSVQKQRIIAFLQKRGTPAAPKYIAEQVYGVCKDSKYIAKALRELLAEGKLIRHTKTGVQNEPVRYEWNPNPPPVESRIFTVGSVWRTRDGRKAVIEEVKDHYLRAKLDSGSVYVYDPTGEACGDDFRYVDLIEPWAEPAPEKPTQAAFEKPATPKSAQPPFAKPAPVSDIRKALNAWRGTRANTAALEMMDLMVSEIERLSAEVAELKKPPVTPEEPKPAEQREYYVNVWQYKQAGRTRLYFCDFCTKQRADHNIIELQGAWKLIGQHHGTYEVEK